VRKNASKKQGGKVMTTTKVNLDQFMTDVHTGTGFTFNTFHTMFRYVNERYFGRTLYAQIKSGQITVDEVVSFMKGAM
jgi:hypothetical protein